MKKILDNVQFLRSKITGVADDLSDSDGDNAYCEVSCQSTDDVVDLFYLLKRHESDFKIKVELYHKEEIEVKLDAVPLRFEVSRVQSYLHRNHGTVLPPGITRMRDEVGFHTGSCTLLMRRRDLDKKPIPRQIDVDGSKIRVSYKEQNLPEPSLPAASSAEPNAGGSFLGLLYSAEPERAGGREVHGNDPTPGVQVDDNLQVTPTTTSTFNSTLENTGNSFNGPLTSVFQTTALQTTAADPFSQLGYARGDFLQQHSVGGAGISQPMFKVGDIQDSAQNAVRASGPTQPMHCDHMHNYPGVETTNPTTSNRQVIGQSGGVILPSSNHNNQLQSTSQEQTDEEFRDDLMSLLLNPGDSPHYTGNAAMFSQAVPAGDLHKQIDDPTEKVKLMERCAIECLDFILRYNENLQRTTYYDVISRMTDFIQSIQSVKVDDEKLAATSKARCWLTIAECHHYLAEYSRAIEVLQLAITTFESTFGDGYRKMALYSACFNNMGFYYYCNNQPEEAEIFYIKSFHANQEVENKSEQLKIEHIHRTINNLCKLYQDHPTMTREKGSDVYSSLQQQKHLTGLPRFWNMLSSLRLMILLNLDGDVKSICNELATMATNISPPADQCNRLCFSLRATAQLLISKNDGESVMSLIRFGMKWSELIPDADDELYRLRDFAFIMAEQASKLTSSPSHLVTIAGGFIPLCEQIIEKIKRSKNVDQQIKDKWLSLTLNHTSHCYLKVKGYDKALQLANQALDILPLDIGQLQNLRDKFKGEIYYCIGVSNFNLKNFDSANSALSKAIKLLEKYSGQKDRINEARQCLSEINSLDCGVYDVFNS
ncbi:unnamed protein product [Clavelina lepadiformis]|uniref:Uncharacterized protein n=1 Tax=Clavelina lepadiformis TaxID=159417 RepID=A0ABP0FRS2_CLALP